jgi:hypothetical protein
MSISAISSNLVDLQNPNVQNNKQQFKKEFAQLGQDLQAGDLAAAQADFATIQQNEPGALAKAQSDGTSAIGKDLNQLSQDLQAGDLTAAQKDFQAVHQDIQNHLQQVGLHNNHLRGISGLREMFQQLGKDLQSGDIKGAQEVYAKIQQEIRGNGNGNGVVTPDTPSSPSTSVTA